MRHQIRGAARGVLQFIETSRDTTRERIEEQIRPIARTFPPYRAAEAEELVNQKIGDMTKSLWYPQIEIKRIWDKRWDAIQAINPKYPVYVISKGRWKRNLRFTSRWLDEMMVPHSSQTQSAVVEIRMGPPS